MRNGVMGGLLGAAAAIIVILVIYMTNDTIRTSDDIERYLGLSTLGTIPLGAGEKKSPRAGRTGRQKKSQGGKRQ